MTRRIFYRVFLPALAVLAVLVLTSCDNQAAVEAQLKSIGDLPLWQRVTAIAVSSLISEDLACIMAGILASEHVMPLGWALGASLIGIFFGDVALYAIGKLGGISLLRRIPFRWWISEKRIIQAESLFEEHGGKLIFTSRLLPGSRLPVYAAAGVLNYPFWKFAIFMSLAGGLSVVILVPLSYHLGGVVFEWLRVYEAYAIPVIAVFAILVWIGVKLFEILATKRSRLVFLAKCRKLLHKFRSSPPNDQ